MSSSPVCGMQCGRRVGLIGFEIRVDARISWLDRAASLPSVGLTHAARADQRDTTPHSRAKASRVLPISSTPLPFHRNFTTLSRPSMPPEYRSAIGVAGGDGRVVDAVEPVGVRHTGGDELAEMEQHRAGVRVLGVGVGLDDHRRQLRAFVVVARQRLGVPRLIASRVAGQLGDGLDDLGCGQVDRARVGRRRWWSARRRAAAGRH